MELIDKINQFENFKNKTKEEVKEGAIYFLKILNNQVDFKIELHNKNNNCDIQISLKNVKWYQIFGDLNTSVFYINRC